MRHECVSKYCFQLIFFREKIAFFTRKGLSVPELPTELAAAEEESADEAALTEIKSTDTIELAELESAVDELALAELECEDALELTKLEYNRSVVENGTEKIELESSSETILNLERHENVSKPEPNTSDVVVDSDDRFDYVIDRTLGVEV